MNLSFPGPSRPAARACLKCGMAILLAAGCLGQMCASTADDTDTQVLGYIPDAPPATPDSGSTGSTTQDPPATGIDTTGGSGSGAGGSDPADAGTGSGDTTGGTTTDPGTTTGGTVSSPPTTLPITQQASAHPNRAFPTAEGFGASARGGRGGRILRVTNLLDYDPTTQSPITGSLRWAVESQTGPRIVVFRLGGTINLKRVLRIEGESASYLTIAGQTAPGGGIQLADYGVCVYRNAHDVVIRHIRIRPGVTAQDTWTDPDGSGPLPAYLDKWDTDALTVYGLNGETVWNVMIDHCSLEWAIDENANIWDAVNRVTLQYCIFAEGSSFGHYGHPEMYPYTHSCGLLAGGANPASSMYLTLHHNLFMNNNGRNPQLNSNGCRIDMVNNLFYNCGSYATFICRDTGSSVAQGPLVNIIGNQYVYGPDDAAHVRRMVSLGDTGGGTAVAGEDATIYIQGNLDHWRQNTRQDEWDVVFDGVDPYRTNSANLALLLRKRRATAWVSPGVAVATESASTVAGSVLAEAGARIPSLDAVDTRLMQMVANGTGRIGFGPQGGYDTHPVLAAGTPLADQDLDGMPDAWEREQGLDPASPADALLDPDGDGYTNIEEYLNELAGDE